MYIFFEVLLQQAYTKGKALKSSKQPPDQLSAWNFEKVQIIALWLQFNIIRWHIQKASDPTLQNKQVYQKTH